MIVYDIEDPEQEVVVRYLNPSEFFGAMGLFSEEHLTANRATRAPREFGRFSYQEFQAIRLQFQDVLNALTTQIGRRQKNRPADLLILHLSTCTNVFIGRSFS